MSAGAALISPHGGYRQLKSFRVAQLVYDITVHFCGRYISPRSRTHDQMVQAARSGVQNIAEGSVASATSNKMELKLTQVARASLEELRLDYEDYLRQRGLPQWPPEHPALRRFKALRCAELKTFRLWVADEVRGGVGGEHGRTRTSTEGKSPSVDPSVPSSVRVRVAPTSGVPPTAPDVCAANGVLSLLNLACFLLDQQVRAQAARFEREGGFTERLYRVRSARRAKGES